MCRSRKLVRSSLFCVFELICWLLFLPLGIVRLERYSTLKPIFGQLFASISNIYFHFSWDCEGQAWRLGTSARLELRGPWKMRRIADKCLLKFYQQPLFISRTLLPCIPRLQLQCEVLLAVLYVTMKPMDYVRPTTSVQHL